MQEHLLVKIGGDSRGLVNAVGGISTAVNSVKSKVGGIGSALGISLGAASFATWVAGAVQFTDAIADASESTGLGTTTLQEWYHVMGQAGMSTEKTRASLEKFTNTLGEAKGGNAAAIEKFRALGIEVDKMSSSDALEAVRNRINAIEDPARRAAVAVDIFGKSGARMLEGLRDFEKLREGASILSEEDIANVARFGDTVEALATQSKVGFGMMISWASKAFDKLRTDVAFLFKKGSGMRDFLMPADKSASDVASDLKDLATAAGLSAQETDKLQMEGAKLYDTLRRMKQDRAFDAMGTPAQLKELEGRYAELARKAALYSATSREGLELQIEQEKLALQITEKRAAVEKNAADQRLRAAQIRSDFRQAFDDRSKLSLADVANLGEDGTRLTAAALRKRTVARQIQDLEFQAREARLQDDPARARELTGQALKLRRSLGGVLDSAESDPMALLKANEETRDAIQALLKAAKAEGLIVQPKMGGK